MIQFELQSPGPRQDLDSFFMRLHECRDKGRLTHGLHPYPAKFIPHIPEALLAAYAPPGGTVWDPMCGSGTTVVEASVGGWRSVGTDLNPIGILAARAKTARLNPTERRALKRLAIELRRRRLDRAVEPPDFLNRDKWFSEQVAAELADCKLLIDAELDGLARVVALCSFSAIIVAVSNQESETRWCAKPHDLPPHGVYRKLSAKLDEAIKRLQSYSRLDPAPVRVLQADARRSGLGDAEVDTVITSPPYANAHDYYLYNKLRMFWLGHDVRPVQEAEIGSRNRHSDLKRDIGTYLEEMLDVYAEIARVLRPGGIVVLVVADAVVRGEFFDVGDLLTDTAALVGLELVDCFDFDHRKFNAAFQRGFGTGHEKRTHVLVHARPS